MTLDPSRYPMGRPERRTLTPPERAEMIAAMEALPAQLRAAVAGLSDEQLDTRYRDGGWTIRQVVHHLPDSHTNGYCRFKLTVTEDVPTIRGYEEHLWAELGEAKSGPVELSLALIDAVHAPWTAFLHTLPDEAWSRRLVYSDGSETDLDALLCIYSWHGPHHVAHITGVRERNGW